MGRDRGRGKRGGRTGGRRSYIANIEELQKREAEGGSDEEEEDDEEDEEEVGAKTAGAGADTVFNFRPKAERDALRTGSSLPQQNVIFLMEVYCSRGRRSCW